MNQLVKNTVMGRLSNAQTKTTKKLQKNTYIKRSDNHLYCSTWKVPVGQVTGDAMDVSPAQKIGHQDGGEVSRLVCWRMDDSDTPSTSSITETDSVKGLTNYIWWAWAQMVKYISQGDTERMGIPVYVRNVSRPVFATESVCVDAAASQISRLTLQLS